MRMIPRRLGLLLLLLGGMSGLGALQFFVYKPLRALAEDSLHRAAEGSASSEMDSDVDSEMDSETGLRTLSPEEVAQYEFDIIDTETTISALSMGQRYLLRQWRQNIADLVARRLGVVQLRGDRRDLPSLQKLVDNKHIKPGDIETWQGLGIVFGDLLVQEFGLEWVSYQDERGVSKALRYRKTDNYVFPVTLFSKRVEFKEKVDLQHIYEHLAVEIAAFQAREESKINFNRSK